MSDQPRVMRRRGKPNRGGGRFNHPRGRGSRGGRGFSERGSRRGDRGSPRGSRGGAEGRKAGASADADGYWDDCVVMAKDTTPSPSYHGRHYRGSRGSTRASHGRNKVAMQRLHMSVENQEMVRDMLKDLRSKDEEDASSAGSYEYDELDWRAEDQYWMADTQLVVEDTGTSLQTEVDHYEVMEQSVNKLALMKLKRYGFFDDYCVEALKENDGDIGKSLESLLSQCFHLELSVDESQPDVDTGSEDASWEEILEQRTEEKVALESIYGETFIERIPNRVWVIFLDLPILTKLAVPTNSEHTNKARFQSTGAEDTRPKCKYFARGSCRFGSKCNYRHAQSQVLVTVAQPGEDDVVSGKSEYQLEIRFPQGNRYPLQAPFLAFSSTDVYLPHHVCLNITMKLVAEAQNEARNCVPVVFTLMNLLEDEDVLRELYEASPHKFSLPKPVLSRREVDNGKQNWGQRSAECMVTGAMHVTKQVRKLRLDDENMEPTLDSQEEENTEDVQQDVRVTRYSRKDVLPGKRCQREIEAENRRLKERFKRTKGASAYQTMQEQRHRLPAWEHQERILNAVNDHQVVVVSGMTGCGKTTQVPQFILDAALATRGPGLCNIVCTQPRRISALAVAERVAEERADKLGNVIGYQIRLESVQSKMTRLLFCTTGILLRRLEGDGQLEGVTHVIIDEVHERSEESDFLMMILRDVLTQRLDLKVILMSATLKAELFSEYFYDAPVIEIPGRTFPVEQFFLEDAIECTKFVMDEGSAYARPLKHTNAVPFGGKGGARSVSLEFEDADFVASGHGVMPAKDNVQDQNLSPRQLFLRFPDHSMSTIKTLSMMDHEKINYDLIESLLEWIVKGNHEHPKGGAILVFLPGMAEITTMYEQLLSNSVMGNQNKHKFKLIPLHSTLSSEEQHAVFSRPKEGVTKIVLSTNIAETSITIDDVVYVVDAGRMKEKRYDSSKGMESLDTVWVSRANAMQRKGRAGRVAAGVCFHLFTSHHFDHHLRDQPIPEIQRAPLEQIVLKIKMLDIFFGQGVEDVMRKLIEPPQEASITSAIHRLQDLGALDWQNQLTSLGYHLAALPVDVRIGKLMLFGAIFRCLDPALTIAATLSYKSPFVSPFGKRDEADKKKLEFAVGNSDHLTMFKAYKGWREALKNGSYAGYCYCRENYLSIKTLQMLASMKRQFAELLSDIGFIKDGLTSRDIEQRARGGSDGLLEAAGPEANSNSENMKLVAAILVAALYPNVVQVMTPENKYSQTSVGAVPKAPKPEQLKFKTKTDGYVHIHPSSVNFQVRYYESPYLVYHEKVKTSKVYLRDCTMVSVYPLLLFGGGSISIDLDKGQFLMSVDEGWIRFMAASHQIAELVRELRLELDQLLADKIDNPNMDLCTCPTGSKIIRTIVKLITTQ